MIGVFLAMSTLSLFAVVGTIWAIIQPPIQTNEPILSSPREGTEAWQLDRKNAHPRAVELLKDDFFWTCLDDDSPFGNDDGADALRLYQQWQSTHRNQKPIQFLNDLLLQMEAPLAHWKTLSPNTLNSFVNAAGDGFVLRTGDQVIIAVGFGQLILDGKIDPELRLLTLKAIDNEADPLMLHRWSVAEERASRLTKMKTIVVAI